MINSLIAEEIKRYNASFSKYYSTKICFYYNFLYKFSPYSMYYFDNNALATVV